MRCLPCHSSPFHWLCVRVACAASVLFSTFLLCVSFYFFIFATEFRCHADGADGFFWMKGGVKSSSHTSGYLHIQLSFGELRERTEILYSV